MQKKINKVSLFLIWIFPLFGYQFFQYTGFNKEVVIFSSVLFFAIMIIYTNDFIFFKLYKNSLIRKYQHLVYWIFACTLISPFIFWGQSLFLNFRISIEIYRYIFFFLLLKAAISEKELVKLIDFYLIVNLILKFLFLKFELVGVFGFEGDFGDNDLRGILRPRFDGLEFVVLAYFLHIGRYKNNGNQRDLVFIFLALIAIILELARQYIFFSIVLGVVLFIKSSRYKFIYITGIAILLYFLPSFLMKTQLPIVKDLVQLSQDQLESNNKNEKDIRLVETEYFFKDFNDSIPQVIIGNGLPHAYSDYGKKIMRLSSNELLYSNDVGYAHIFLYSGVVGLFFFMMLFFRSLMISVDPKYLWCKFFLLYIIFTNIASQSMSTSGMTVGIAIYFIVAFGKKQKRVILQ